MLPRQKVSSSRTNFTTGLILQVCALSLQEGRESLGNFTSQSLCSPVVPVLWADLGLYRIYCAVVWTLGELPLLLLCGVLAWQWQWCFGLGEAGLEKVLGITGECCNASSWQPPQIFAFCSDVSWVMLYLKMAATKTKSLLLCLSKPWATQPLKSTLLGGWESLGLRNLGSLLAFFQEHSVGPFLQGKGRVVGSTAVFCIHCARRSKGKCRTWGISHGSIPFCPGECVCLLSQQSALTGVCFVPGRGLPPSS